MERGRMDAKRGSETDQNPALASARDDFNWILRATDDVAEKIYYFVELVCEFNAP